MPFSERQARMHAFGLRMNSTDRPADDDHMHASTSVDFGAVLEGRVCLRLPDGDERVLSAGDCLIQLGNEHAWVNRGQSLCRIAFVVIGADS
jgi:quercetin dioxygenase-like cupin family protein